MAEPHGVERVSPSDSRIRDHLANERTFLAWQRTALTILGLGFVVDRFALGSAGSAVLGSWVGLALVLLGGAASAVGASRYVDTERRIDAGSYRSSITVHLAMVAAILAGAIALAIFLAVNPAGS
jgi:putative membrane protein